MQPAAKLANQTQAQIGAMVSILDIENLAAFGLQAEWFSP